MIASAAALGRAWPAVERSVVRFARSRGVDSSTAEDIAQEVALRALEALQRGRRFESVDELAGWCNRVATHRLIDGWRTRTPGVLQPGREAADGTDIASVVVARLAFAEVAAGFPRLTPSERDAIAGAVDGEPASIGDPRSATRDRVRRHRARLRLRAMVHNLGAIGGWPIVRRASDWLRRNQSAVADGGQVAATVGMSIVVAASAIAGASRGDNDAAFAPGGQPPQASSVVASVPTRHDARHDPRGPTYDDSPAVPFTGAGAPGSPDDAERERGRTEVASVDLPPARGSAGFTDPPEDDALACVALERDHMTCLDSPTLTAPELPSAPPLR